MLSDKYRFEMIPVGQIEPFAKNSRKHSEVQVQQIVNSISEFGFTNPILIDEKNTIIAGHCRLLAVKKIGMETVPCIVLSGLSETQKRALVIADNKLALNAEWDIDILLSEIKSLQDESFDIELTGFSLDEIADITPDCVSVGLCDDDAVPDAPAEPVTKLGDIYTLGNHRLMCGDSTMIDDVEKLMNGEKALLMLTDPPYGVNLDQSWRDEALGDKALGKGNKQKIQNDDRADWTDVYALFKGDIAYIWHASCQTDLVKKNLEDCQLLTRQMIIWNKSIMVMGRSAYHWKHEPCWYAVRKGCDANWKGDRKQTTVWDAASPNHIMSGSKEDKTEHPSQKPVILFEIPINNHTNQNDSVYDPFGGSGSTLIACEKTGRHCYMMEISPQYCDVIVARWEKFTGKKAILNDH
jgi:DNA modification methylase